jgi:hypothetical protein
MPELQESVTRSDGDAREAQAASAQGLGESPDRIVWGRSDWAKPVGYFNETQFRRVHSKVRGFTFSWELVRIPEFWLEHRAAVLLLQGRALTALLIPNQKIQIPSAPPHAFFAHVLLRVDPWEYWQPAPKLTNLVFARLGDLPIELSSAEVLAELAERSSALT